MLSVQVGQRTALARAKGIINAAGHDPVADDALSYVTRSVNSLIDRSEVFSTERLKTYSGF
jgi:hypothetical protein